jgi:hypothetical protein
LHPEQQYTEVNGRNALFCYHWVALLGSCDVVVWIASTYPKWCWYDWWLHVINHWARDDNNWLITHVDYINYGHARRAHIFEEQHLIIDIDVYVDWYMHITYCFITLTWDDISRCPCIQSKLHTPIYNKLVCIRFFYEYNLSVFHIYIYIYILVYIRWCFFYTRGSSSH